MIGRKQQISLAGGCWHHGIVVHEIGKLSFLSSVSAQPRVTMFFPFQDMLLDFGTNSQDLIVMNTSPLCGITFLPVSWGEEGRGERILFFQDIQHNDHLVLIQCY